MNKEMIYRTFAVLIHNERMSIEDVPEQDREAVQHVLDTEFTK